MIYATQSGQKPKTRVQYMYVVKIRSEAQDWSSIHVCGKIRGFKCTIYNFIKCLSYMIDFSINEKYQLYK